MIKYIIKALPILKIKIYYIICDSYKNLHYFDESNDLPSPLKWEEATPELIEKLTNEWKGWKERQQLLKKLIFNGAVGCIIHDGEQWVANSFISPPRVALPYYLPSNLVKNKFWGFYVTTKPEWRGQGLMNQCIMLRSKLMVEEVGATIDIFGDIDKDNIIALKAHLKRNSCKSAGVLRVLELHLPIIDPIIIWWNWNKEEAHPEF